jgi:molybdopterin-guanine dinucleotide biosynthesis protein A
VSATLAPPNPARHQGTEGKSTERLALEEAGLSLEIDESILELANDFLKVLVTQARQNRDWQKILAKTLTDTEIEQNTRVVHDRLEHFHLKTPIGAIIGGTGSLREGRDITGEQAQRAVQLLKGSGRLVQCGRGRGKSLVVLTDKPVPEDVLGRLAPSQRKKPVAKKTPARTTTSSARKTSRDIKAGTGSGKSQSLAEAVVSAAGSDRSIVLILSDLVAKWAEEKRALEAQVTAAKSASNAERLTELISANKALERKVEERDRVILAKEEALQALEQALAEKDLTTWS